MFNYVTLLPLAPTFRTRKVEPVSDSSDDLDREASPFYVKRKSLHPFVEHTIDSLIKIGACIDVYT